MLAAGMEEAVIRAALAGMALVRVGITLALAGMAVAVTGTVVTGTVGVVAGIMVATVVVGELAPRLVSVLALDYSEGRSRPLPIMVAMITATTTRRMQVHPHLRFGIGAMLIRVTTRRYPNARFPGDKLFSKRAAKPLPTSLRRKAVIQLSDLTRWAPATGGCLYEENAESGSVHARMRETPLSSRPTGGPPRSPASSSDGPQSRTAALSIDYGALDRLRRGRPCRGAHRT